MEKTIITASKAPAAIGPYSHAIKANGFVFTSGQIPIDPATGDIVNGIEAQTEQVFKNLIAVLEEAGLGLKNVVKATVFLKDLGDFVAVNGIYGKYFSENPPARSCVQVAALPKDSLVEIEVIAC